MQKILDGWKAIWFKRSSRYSCDGRDESFCNGRSVSRRGTYWKKLHKTILGIGSVTQVRYNAAAGKLEESVI